ncbi:FAD-binding protein [Klebsiella pneumoniae]
MQDAAEKCPLFFYSADAPGDEAFMASGLARPGAGPIMDGPWSPAGYLHKGRLPWPRLAQTALVQVVNTEGHLIPGLYAVGNDMDSLMAGTYPGPGITLGPGLTFGYLAACHLAQHSTH